MRAWTFWDPSSIPSLLDVVWCHFPEKWQPEFPAKKPHPCLVQRIGEKEGQPFVKVAFGTSQLDDCFPPDYLIIRNVADMNEAGLYRNTAFELDNTRWLPWAREFFDCRSLQYSSPVIGQLSGRARIQLQMLVKILNSKKKIQGISDSQ